MCRCISVLFVWQAQLISPLSRAGGGGKGCRLPWEKNLRTEALISMIVGLLILCSKNVLGL